MTKKKDTKPEPETTTTNNVTSGYVSVGPTTFNGWKCPACGGGNAPWVSHCPCVPYYARPWYPYYPVYPTYPAPYTPYWYTVAAGQNVTVGSSSGGNVTGVTTVTQNPGGSQVSWTNNNSQLPVVNTY